MRVLLGLLGLLCIVSFRAEGQGRPDQMNHWLQYTGSYRVTPQWAVAANLQYRSYEPLRNLKTALAGGEIMYRGKTLPVTVGIGYARLWNQAEQASEETDHTQEHRFYQQIALRSDLGRIRVSHRYQVEERWLTQGYHTRLRYFVGLQVPLGKENPPEGKKASWYGILRNEIRVIIQENPFDSNRVYGGLGYVFNKHLTLEGMWMSQLAGERRKHQHYSVFILKHAFGQAK